MDVLCTANTFVCLQNTIFSDLCHSPEVLPSISLSKIRSLHIHFQFREINWEVRDDAAITEFRQLVENIDQTLPRLERLSIFLQGPLSRIDTYTCIGSLIDCLCQDIETLKYAIVRFPEASWEKQPFRNKLKLENIYRLLDHDKIHFQIYVPRILYRQDRKDGTDQLTEYDSGWRVGYIYMDGFPQINWRFITYAVFLGENSKALIP